MGFTPREVDRMSLWEFTACTEGFEESGEGRAPAAAVSDEFLRAHQIEGFS